MGDELLVRSERLITRRVKAASFRDHKTLDDFDFSFNTSVSQTADVRPGERALHSRREGRLAVGPTGNWARVTSAQAIGLAAIKSGLTVYYRSIFDCVRDFLHDEAFDGEDKVLARYLKPDLLIIDDMGMKQLAQAVGRIPVRDHHAAVRDEEHDDDQSNRPLEDWGKLVGDVPSATAILDRFLHHAEIIRLEGKVTD